MIPVGPVSSQEELLDLEKGGQGGSQEGPVWGTQLQPLALEKEGATSQALQVASGSWGRQGRGSP